MRIALAALALLLTVAPAAAGFDALLTAARTENLDLVQAELTAGTDPNPPQWHDSYAPLQFAAGNGDEEMTRLLLEAGADTEYRDHNGERALLWAAYSGTAGTVRLLLDAGSPADAAADPHGETPMMTASWYNHEDMVLLLLGAGADPNRFDQSGVTALHLAARTDNVALVTMLLAAGANPNVISDSLYETPLHEAALRSTPAVIAALVAAGAAPNPRDHSGFTPLLSAAQQGNAANVAALIASYADIDAQAPDGRTPLLVALGPLSERPDRQRAVMELVEVTADIDRGFAAAIGAGNLPAALRLLERGADINAIDADGSSALANAAGLPRMTMFQYLILRGADVERFGIGALLAGAEHGNAEVVRDLLARGIGIESRDASGRTPLLAAVAARQVKMVKLLLAAGADRDARDGLGRGTAELLTVAEMPLEMELERYEQSAAWHPTEDLELDLDYLRENRAEIRGILGLR